MVCGGDVCVGSHHEAGASVNEMTETLFLTGGFGMEIKHHYIRLLAQRTRNELLFRGMERIVEVGMHEYLAHDIGDENTGAVARGV